MGVRKEEAEHLAPGIGPLWIGVGAGRAAARPGMAGAVDHPLLEHGLPPGRPFDRRLARGLPHVRCNAAAAVPLEDRKGSLTVVILIVEDEFLIGWALKLVLHLAGHHAVGPAASAEEALQLAQAEQPELAFVDIAIEGNQDGIALARALAARHGVSCIFLTAQPD
jgi:hypothetical protein